MRRFTLKPTCPPARLCLAGGFVFLLYCLPFQVRSETYLVTPEESLQSVINQAVPGDELHLQPGKHSGPVMIGQPLTLSGEPGAIIDGGGSGRVLTIAAPDVTVRGLTLQNSGTSLATEDSGVFITAEGDRAVVAENRFRDNLIGVYLKGPENAVVRDNVIVGSLDPHVNDRGNGVQLWNTPGSRVERNDIRYGRDGIFVTTSRDNSFRGNTFRDLRFAVHYMYTNASTVENNRSTGNHVGYAMMYSNHISVRGNISERDRDRGLFLNYANESVISDNRVDGAEKCFFIYNANMNRIDNNYFTNCEIGIHFTAGSEGNDVYGNAFVANRNQVKYVGTRYIEWSRDGRGNFWSDNPAFDLDDDGIADQPYRPNDLVDQLVWRHPLAKLLLNSPAMQVLRWAQSEFPTLHPGGVTDSAPLMAFDEGGTPPDG
jgi:nitrous oxidase accessory protein